MFSSMQGCHFRFRHEGGLRRRSTPTNLRVMNSLGLSNSNLNYIYFTLKYSPLFQNCSIDRVQAQEIDTHQYEQKENQLYILMRQLFTCMHAKVTTCLILKVMNYPLATTMFYVCEKAQQLIDGLIDKQLY